MAKCIKKITPKLLSQCIYITYCDLWYKCTPVFTSNSFSVLIFLISSVYAAGLTSLSTQLLCSISNNNKNSSIARGFDPKPLHQRYLSLYLLLGLVSRSFFAVFFSILSVFWFRKARQCYSSAGPRLRPLQRDVCCDWPERRIAQSPIGWRV